MKISVQNMKVDIGPERSSFLGTQKTKETRLHVFSTSVMRHLCHEERWLCRSLWCSYVTIEP